MIQARKTKHIIAVKPPEAKVDDAPEIVETAPLQSMKQLTSSITQQLQEAAQTGTSNTADVGALEAKIDKLISYLEHWIKVGNVNMADIRGFIDT